MMQAFFLLRRIFFWHRGASMRNCWGFCVENGDSVLLAAHAHRDRRTDVRNITGWGLWPRDGSPVTLATCHATCHTCNSARRLWIQGDVTGVTGISTIYIWRVYILYIKEIACTRSKVSRITCHVSHVSRFAESLMISHECGCDRSCHTGSRGRARVTLWIARARARRLVRGGDYVA